MAHAGHESDVSGPLAMRSDDGYEGYMHSNVLLVWCESGVQAGVSRCTCTGEELDPGQLCMESSENRAPTSVFDVT
jgi:hypothetical protein